VSAWTGSGGAVAWGVRGFTGAAARLDAVALGAAARLGAAALAGGAARLAAAVLAGAAARLGAAVLAVVARVGAAALATAGSTARWVSTGGAPTGGAARLALRRWGRVRGRDPITPGLGSGLMVPIMAHDRKKHDVPKNSFYL
jgi:hypothetical protein